MRSQFLPFLQWNFFVNVQKSHHFWVRSSWKKKTFGSHYLSDKGEHRYVLEKTKVNIEFWKSSYFGLILLFFGKFRQFSTNYQRFPKSCIGKIGFQKWPKHEKKAKHEDLTYYPTKVNIATYSRQKKWTPMYEKCCFFTNFHCFCASISRIFIKIYEYVERALVECLSLGFIGFFHNDVNA